MSKPAEPKALSGEGGTRDAAGCGCVLESCANPRQPGTPATCRGSPGRGSCEPLTPPLTITHVSAPCVCLSSRTPHVVCTADALTWAARRTDPPALLGGARDSPPVLADASQHVSTVPGLLSTGTSPAHRARTWRSTGCKALVHSGRAGREGRTPPGRMHMGTCRGPRALSGDLRTLADHGQSTVLVLAWLTNSSERAHSPIRTPKQ